MRDSNLPATAQVRFLNRLMQSEASDLLEEAQKHSDFEIYKLVSKLSTLMDNHEQELNKNEVNEVIEVIDTN